MFASEYKNACIIHTQPYRDRASTHSYEEGMDMSPDDDGPNRCAGGGSCGCRTDVRESSAIDSPDPTAADADSEDASETTMPDLGQSWTIDDLDDDWEARAREKLGDVDYDTDLGVEISRDAMRLARGELTREEFHDRHGEAVENEFGVDERPTKPEPPGPEDGRSLPGVPDVNGNSPMSRRNLMKAMGGIAAASGASAVATAATGGDIGSAAAAGGDEDAGTGGGDGETVQLGMAIDMDRCIACMMCAEACKEENNTDRGAHWMHVFRFEEDEYGDRREGYMPRPCQHCSEPSCTYVCPTQARFKRDEDGLVLTDYDTCIGCKYCEVACPYGVNFLGKGEPTEHSSGFHGEQVSGDRSVGGPSPQGVMGKCTFCVHRQDDATQRGTTACADDCPVDAIHFGDMHDRDSDPRSYMREKEGESRFKLLDDLGNEPNVVYLGEKPSKDAEPIDGPFTYEDLGMEKLGEHAGRGEQP